MKAVEVLGSHAQNQDRMLHAALGRMTPGISPASIAGAFMDWGAHLVFSPGKQQALGEKALRKWHRLMLYALQSAQSRCDPCIEPLPRTSASVTGAGRSGHSI